MTADAPSSVGLAGDGDEIAAITDVEEAFGVKLDYSDAGSWHTAGDVFTALHRALPEEEAGRRGTWQRFTTALARESGIDPTMIEPASPLLLPQPSGWVRVAHASTFIFLLIAVALIVTAILSLF